MPAQRVAFGTSGHRGCSFERGFNEWHVLAISQAICDYRKNEDIDGPLYIGVDTHALSGPAFESALEVLAANGLAAHRTFVPYGSTFFCFLGLYAPADPAGGADGTARRARVHA